MTTVDEQAMFLTAVQQACRKARESRTQLDLQKAAALIDSPRLNELPEAAQDDLLEDYSRTMLAVTGAFS